MKAEAIRGDSHTFIFKSEVSLLGQDYILTFSRSADPLDERYTLFSKPGTVSEDGLELRFEVLPEDTNDLSPGELYFDVQFKNENNRVTSIRKQSITLVADVTRS